MTTATIPPETLQLSRFIRSVKPLGFTVMLFMAALQRPVNKKELATLIGVGEATIDRALTGLLTDQLVDRVNYRTWILTSRAEEYVRSIREHWVKAPGQMPLEASGQQLPGQPTMLLAPEVPQKTLPAADNTHNPSRDQQIDMFLFVSRNLQNVDFSDEGANPRNLQNVDFSDTGPDSRNLQNVDFSTDDPRNLQNVDFSNTEPGSRNLQNVDFSDTGPDSRNLQNVDFSNGDLRNLQNVDFRDGGANSRNLQNVDFRNGANSRNLQNVDFNNGGDLRNLQNVGFSPYVHVHGVVNTDSVNQESQQHVHGADPRNLQNVDFSPEDDPRLELLVAAGVWQRKARELAADTSLTFTPRDIVAWAACLYAPNARDGTNSPISRPAAVLAANLSKGNPGPREISPPAICAHCHLTISPTHRTRCLCDQPEPIYPPEMVRALVSAPEQSNIDSWGICIDCQGLPCQCAEYDDLPEAEPEGEGLPVIAANDQFLDTSPDGSSMTYRQIWQALLGELGIQMNRATYNTWLEPTRLIDVVDGRFVVAAPQHSIAWLDSRLKTTIDRSLTGIVGRSTTVQFVTSEVITA